jgi:hypothetical protein
MDASRRVVIISAVIAFILSLLRGVRVHSTWLDGDLLNPDSFMRLVRLEAILQAHAPLDAVARDGMTGTVLHWSHLLDSLLLVLAAPAAALFGWHQALAGLALLAGPLSMAALGAALAWAVAPFATRLWRWTAAVVAAGSAPIMSYGLPGVVHHHVLLIVVAVMAAGWAARIIRGADASAGISLGAWAGAGLWLSPESMPLSLMAMCAVWLAWLMQPPTSVRRHPLARNLAAAGVTLFAVVTAAWLVDPPANVWAVEPDRVGIVFVALAGGVAVCGVAALGLARWLVTLIGGALAAAWLAAFPVLLRGTYGLLPPDVAHAFLDGISEMRPLRSAGEVVECLALAALATAVLAVMGVRRRSPVLLYAAGCGALLLLGGTQHVRFAAYPAAFGAALLPVALTAMGASQWRVGVLALAVLVPQAGALVSPSTAASLGANTCTMKGVPALLAPYAGQVVLADVDITPELLWRTGVQTVGSLYHRNPAAFMRLRAAWISAPGQSMPQAVAATGARLLLVCPGAPLANFITGAPSPTLAGALNQGLVPPWLHPVGTAAAGGFVLYAADVAETP